MNRIDFFDTCMEDITKYSDKYDKDSLIELLASYTECLRKSTSEFEISDISISDVTEIAKILKAANINTFILTTRSTNTIDYIHKFIENGYTISPDTIAAKVTETIMLKDDTPYTYTVNGIRFILK